MFADRATAIEADQVVLTPLRIVDSHEMVQVLADPELYRFTGGHPPDLLSLQRRYRAQTAGSPVPGEYWHNWIVRERPGNAAVGYVQATVIDRSADVAWVIGTPWQGRGLATQAARAMCAWLRAEGLLRVNARIHPDHVASAAVAAACGLARTDDVDDDGEVLWTWPA